jgi:hypothetical protein
VIDAVVIEGPRFKAPTFESLRTYLLLESVDDVNLILAEFHSSWVELLDKFSYILSKGENVSQIGGCLGQS